MAFFKQITLHADLIRNSFDLERFRRGDARADLLINGELRLAYVERLMHIYHAESEEGNAFVKDIIKNTIIPFRRDFDSFQDIEDCLYREIRVGLVTTDIGQWLVFKHDNLHVIKEAIKCCQFSSKRINERILWEILFDLKPGRYFDPLKWYDYPLDVKVARFAINELLKALNVKDKRFEACRAGM